MKKYAIFAVCTLALVNTVPMIPAYASTPAYTAARPAKKQPSSQKKIETAAAAVQKAFHTKNLKALSELCNYPLVFSYGSGEVIEIKNKTDLQAMGNDQIFTKKLCEAIESTNIAKLAQVGNSGVQMGQDMGLNLYQTDGNWKVNSIYSDLKSHSETLDYTNLQEAAVTIQKCFSYHDLETLSKLCNYPVTVVYRDGTVTELKDAKAFIAQGEDKFFTSALLTNIDHTDVSKLKPVGTAGAQMGGNSGLALYSFNGYWKINNIYQ